MTAAIYIITNPNTPLPIIKQALATAHNKTNLIQIHNKHATNIKITALIKQLLPHITTFKTKLIINNQIKITLHTKTYGLHIGQNDSNIKKIHHRLPLKILLSLSIKTINQTQHIPPKINYIDTRPIQTTATKPNHTTPISLNGLTTIIATAQLPTYTINNIKHRNARTLQTTKTIRLAIISSITRTPNPETATTALLAK